MPRFLGFDHIDTRVSSLAAVERFYDCLLPALGLAEKKHSHVDADGEWHNVDETHIPNAAEWFETAESGDTPVFMGVIEDPLMEPTATRIAFRIGSRAELEGWFERLGEFGAQKVERSADMEAYPAIFFEDPAGTKLELCTRNPRTT
ncbi:MAG: hypothetical protein GIW95_09650 [Candidatus Eremiobacteraeota bacterium]|nr:hypothetical protein [Candidatus Eremiobacteraeota bacterium]